MTTVLLDRLPATLKNLNASTLTATTYGADDGLYALINDMISNLSSIKASLKTEEKNIHTGLAQELVPGASDINTATTVVEPAQVSAATVVAASTGTRGDVFSASTTAEAAKNVAVLTVGTKKYTEAAVFSVLKPQAQVIRDLKAGTITDYRIATTAAYDGPLLVAP